MSKKENKKFFLKLIIPLAVILLIFLSWFVFLNIWAVKPSNKINSIKLSVLDEGGYSNIIIVNDKEIFEIRDLVCKLKGE